MVKYLLMILLLLGCKLEKTIFINKDVKNEYINEQLELEKVQEDSGAKLKCYCSTCIEQFIEEDNIEFDSSGDLEPIGPFDINPGSVCQLTTNINYKTGWRKYVLYFVTDETDEQTETLVIE